MSDADALEAIADEVEAGGGPVALVRPGHRPVVLVSAEEWQRLDELESAESTAWWHRDAAERRDASGEGTHEGEDERGLDESEFRRRFAYLFDLVGVIRSGGEGGAGAGGWLCLPCPPVRSRGRPGVVCLLWRAGRGGGVPRVSGAGSGPGITTSMKHRCRGDDHDEASMSLPAGAGADFPGAREAQGAGRVRGAGVPRGTCAQGRRRVPPARTRTSREPGQDRDISQRGLVP